MSDISDEEMYSSDEDLSDQEEEGHAGPGPGSAPKQHIYNADAIHEKLEDIAWAEEAAWEESLVVTNAEPTVVANCDDDLERELAFYNQALAATLTAIQTFNQSGAPWLRPPDYYAEMVKSDEHMSKVKDRLMYEQQQIEQADERRKAREQKAYAKQVQAEKQKERTRDKKRQIEAVSAVRKQREKSGFAGELDFEAAMEEQGQRQQQRAAQQQQRQQGKGRPGERISGGFKTPSKKRQVKNEKFGFGGRKRLRKQNDAFSSASMEGYKPGRFEDGLGRKKGSGGVQKKKAGQGGKGGGAQRPGKARRQQMKSKKGRG